MKYRFTLILFLTLFCVDTFAKKPNLIVNIVVSSMRAEDLDRYAHNFTKAGLLRLLHDGTQYTDSRYNYQQTTTPVSLATLTTGALPSTHGVVSAHWRDYVENTPVSLIGEGAAYSPRNLIAPTLGETLLQYSPKSQLVSVAMDPVSAIVMSGKGGQAFWMDSLRCDWSSSPYYVAELPNWVHRQNKEGFTLSYLYDQWNTLLPREYYLNTRRWDVAWSNPTAKELKQKKKAVKPLLTLHDDRDRMRYTPAGNTATLGFAKMAIAQFRLGADTIPDVLNICLDTSRTIAEAYGPESVEMEDMYYRLDKDLSDFLTFVYAQAKDGNALVVLTSDHGTSPSYDLGKEPTDRFNTRQFEVIVNSFLNVRYGVGAWVLEYEDKCIYLNHNLIYERGLNLAELQNETAIFVMQFRGVSHALSATAMRTSYFGSGYAQKMQNSFYPRRSGDVIINLMPGWIEERDRCRSASGSMYGYDNRVPLIFYGPDVESQTVAHPVEMSSVAPTLARLLNISCPAASEGSVLTEIVSN
ncbi:MAG: alkaline phosphatase family protein [Alistipes sp.]